MYSAPKGAWINCLTRTINIQRLTALKHHSQTNIAS